MNNINYCVAGTKCTLGEHAGEVLYRPYLQISRVITLDDIAEHMSEHNCKYNEGDIISVLKQFVDCTCEMILDGCKIDLGKLGALMPSIRVTSESSAEEVTTDNIKDLKLVWQPGSKTGNLREKAVFNLVGKRKNQKLLVSAEKNGQTSMTLAQTSQSGNSGGVSGE